MKCFTLFYEHIIREFGTDYASVSLINALMYVAYAFASKCRCELTRNCIYIF